MIGYHDKPQETAAALRDGWYHTGDLAKSDENGFLTITGRLKELIIRGGQNIDPAMIEEIQRAVSIPVMAKCRIGHVMEARILEALEVDVLGDLGDGAVGWHGEAAGEGHARQATPGAAAGRASGPSTIGPLLELAGSGAQCGLVPAE